MPCINNLEKSCDCGFTLIKKFYEYIILIAEHFKIHAICFNKYLKLIQILIPQQMTIFILVLLFDHKNI